MPGSSKCGEEYRKTVAAGEAYGGVDASYRSSYFADASASDYLRIGGYTLVNTRIGFTSDKRWEVFALVRNVFNTKYATLLTPQSGNSGLYSGVPDDPRTVQLTVRYRLGD